MKKFYEFEVVQGMAALKHNFRLAHDEMMAEGGSERMRTLISTFWIMTDEQDQKTHEFDEVLEMHSCEKNCEKCRNPGPTQKVLSARKKVDRACGDGQINQPSGSEHEQINQPSGSGDGKEARKSWSIKIEVEASKKKGDREVLEELLGRAPATSLLMQVPVSPRMCQWPLTRVVPWPEGRFTGRLIL